MRTSSFRHLLDRRSPWHCTMPTTCRDQNGAHLVPVKCLFTPKYLLKFTAIFSRVPARGSLYEALERILGPITDLCEVLLAPGSRSSIWTDRFTRKYPAKAGMIYHICPRGTRRAARQARNDAHRQADVTLPRPKRGHITEC